MSRPIKKIQVNAPLNNSEYNKVPSPETFAKFIFIPEYKAAQRNWPNYEIRFEVLLTDKTVDSGYFLDVNMILKRECRELIGRYILLQK